MKGRKPKPTNLKVLNGNPGKRPLNQNEPKPKGRPRCPSWLHDDAKKEWKRLAPELERLGLLTMVDMAAFVGYCESYALYKDCIEYIHAHGSSYTIEDEAGNPKAFRSYPQVGQANQHLINIRSFASEFGFTPSSRGRIEIGNQDELSPMEAYLKRKQSER